MREVLKKIFLKGRILFSIFLLLFIQKNIWCEATISKESAKLEELRLLVEKDPSTKNEMAYLNLFPSNFQKFRFIFYGKNDELGELYYKTWEHLQLLLKLSKKYKEKVLSIWLGVAENGHWDADAIGELQQQLACFGAEHTKDFAEALQKKPEKIRLSIIKFLADMENHNIYDSYKNIIHNLKELKYHSLQKAFIKARDERMQMKDH